MTEWQLYTAEQFGFHFSLTEWSCATEVYLLKFLLRNILRNLPGFHS